MPGLVPAMTGAGIQSQCILLSRVTIPVGMEQFPRAIIAPMFVFPSLLLYVMLSATADYH
jgi:hypothetical protein